MGWSGVASLERAFEQWAKRHGDGSHVEIEGKRDCEAEETASAEAPRGSQNWHLRGTRRGQRSHEAAGVVLPCSGRDSCGPDHTGLCDSSTGWILARVWEEALQVLRKGASAVIEFLKITLKAVSRSNKREEQEQKQGDQSGSCRHPWGAVVVVQEDGWQRWGWGAMSAWKEQLTASAVCWLRCCGLCFSTSLYFTSLAVEKGRNSTRE